MALNIKDQETHRLARALAERHGTTMTEAVHRALEDAVRRSDPGRQPKYDRLDEISRHCAALPVLDDRTADEIAGYDEQGLPR